MLVHKPDDDMIARLECLNLFSPRPAENAPLLSPRKLEARKRQALKLAALKAALYTPHPAAALDQTPDESTPSLTNSPDAHSEQRRAQLPQLALAVNTFPEFKIPTLSRPPASPKWRRSSKEAAALSGTVKHSQIEKRRTSIY